MSGTPTQDDDNGLVEADDRALKVRAQYEQIEQRVLGRTWTLPELAVGFTNDAAYVGRLVLAAEHTWDIDGDVDAELRHKLAECLWWVFVLADRLDVDMPEAYAATMDRIDAGLQRTLRGMSA
ncbi:hypothetical protein OKJ48_14480 [Streptomyces kunmingensis]|uniref:MazG-like protein n=1 Tax=Streptomyces kunmingensis TaxID=68225 RepID=A0ABU6CAE5_9ACTN|nr:hypothetical protein [Streptomyces kunmingensis]MEB3961444.1 hypothetical protein [Streptomyces kunmingensis]